MMTPNDALDRLQLTLNCAEVSLSKTIRQIQLDAMKEGMRRAAEIQIHTGEINGGLAPEFKWKGLQEVRVAILTAAEQLTEKDF